MTLVITELSHYGIAMAADTAWTLFINLSNGRRYPRVLKGAVKLMPVSRIQAGISYWGLGQLDGIPTDDWLRRFLDHQDRRYNSLAGLSTLLQTELRRHVRRINLTRYPYGTIGMQLAGFVDTPAGRYPAFYHIHNGPSQALQNANIDPRQINANFDRPPQAYSPNMFYRTRNGDFQLYATVFQALEDLFDDLGEEGFVIPDANALHVTPLRARAEYLRFHIKTMARIYEMSNVVVPGSISEEVTTLTISEAGIQEYWTR